MTYDEDAIDLSGSGKSKSGDTVEIEDFKAQPTETGGLAITRDFFLPRKSDTDPNEDRFSAVNISISPKQDIAASLERSIRQVEKDNRHRLDGAAIAAAAIADEKVYTSNLGDVSVIAFIHHPGNDTVEAIKITRDHSMKDPQEQALFDRDKITLRDGEPVLLSETQLPNGKHRTINISRAIGDRQFSLVRTPESHMLDLKPYLDKGDNVYIAVGSDGITEGTTLGDMRKLVEQTIKSAKKSTNQLPDLKEIAAHLVEYRHENGVLEPWRPPGGDDSTVVLQKIERQMQTQKPGQKKNVTLLTVADGHAYNPDNSYPDFLPEIVVEKVPFYFRNPHLVRDSEISQGKS